MKKSGIFVLIIVFLAFLSYQTFKTTDYAVLKVLSPIQIVVDINDNGIQDDDETIFVGLKSFSLKLNQEQKNFAKELKISEEEAIGLGYLAQNFAKDTLADKKVKLKNKNIIIDNKNYETLLFNSGLAFNGKGNYNHIKFEEKLKKVHFLNLRIFNNKNHKYHKLTCKYGQIAHNAQIIPQGQLPKDASPCKFCFESSKNSKNSAKRKFAEDIIPYVAQSPTVFKTQSIQIFLTDFTRVLKPTNNCETDFCQVLLKEIDSAQNSIDFAIYGYTKIPKIQTALDNAQKRGVKIRFVYDLDDQGLNIYPDTLALSQVLKNNNSDKLKQIMHNKFFIFDKKTVLTGSANISNTDLSGFNSNAVVLINSSQVAEIFSKEFEQMFSSKFHKEKIKIDGTENINIDGEDFSIYFSPQNHAITDNIIPLTDNAKKYIYMPIFLITHKGLAESLIRASNRGVAVKVILDATNAHGSYSKHKFLRQNGVLVKTENFAGKLHSKSIIIDDMYTIIGSMNFSRSGENVNDENVIIIKSPEIANFYKTFFQYLWKRIPDKWLTKNARAESPDSIGSCCDGVDNDFDGKIDMQDDSCVFKKYK